jgi:YfiH family protein
MSVEPQPPAAGRILSEPPAVQADALAHVRHGFFGRGGGVSAGIYASLNAGTGSRDEPECVRENRRRIAASFGAAPDMLVGVHQVHSPDAVFIDAPWSGERPHADALVTTNPALVLSVLTADCGPVLLADKEAGVIAAAHAGWRGAFGGVLASTVKLMIEHGARADRICAAVGPCIQQQSYEVGADFRDTFSAADPANTRFFSDEFGPKPHFDLPAFCAHQLALLGVGDVEIVDIDTFRDERYFSHRRSLREAAPDYGRNCAAISLG